MIAAYHVQYPTANPFLIFLVYVRFEIMFDIGSEFVSEEVSGEISVIFLMILVVGLLPDLLITGLYVIVVLGIISGIGLSSNQRS